MKPVLAALGVLFLVMLVYVWMDGKLGFGPALNRNTQNKIIYFEPEGKLEVGEEKIFIIKANYKEGAIGSFNLEFQYDPAVVRASEVKVNENIFDQVILRDVDENSGKIRMQAGSSKTGTNLSGGIVDLATVKMRGLKKDGMTITSSKKAEVGVWEKGKKTESVFQFSGFKVTVW